jgi:hypothetical protein
LGGIGSKTVRSVGGELSSVCRSRSKEVRVKAPIWTGETSDLGRLEGPAALGLPVLSSDLAGRG